jgi:glycosyltransferase involved in cell wall biosynthesis
LYVNPTYKASGAEFSLLSLMDNLDRSAYEPIILCPNDGLLPQLCQERNIRTVFLPTIPLPGGRAIDTYRTLPHNIQAIKTIMKELGIDLVHSNSPRVAYHSGLAARWAGIPNVTHVRDMSITPFESILKALFVYAISDRIVAVSQATKNAIVKLFPYAQHKIQVVYNGVKPAPKFDPLEIHALRAEFGANDQTILLATIGQLAHWKGHDVVLQALPAIRAKYPNTRLLIVGEVLHEEAHRSYLMELADQLQVSQHVVFTGFRQDVPLILSAVDLLIHYPVEPDPLPRILLEASAQETLIVASDIGGIGEVVLDGTTGWLVPPGQPAILAEAILSLLSNPDLAVQMRAAAGERARQVFSIEQHVASLEAIYRSLLRQA